MATSTTNDNSGQTGDSVRTNDFGNELISIARRSIEAAVLKQPLPQFEISHSRLQQALGVFVTLYKQGKLRGCIGLIESDLPVWKGVRKMARAAALDDPRFPPVKPAELEQIEIEVSVLTRPEKVEDVGQIEVGKHGVIMKKGMRKGVFLPQVATEQGYNREQFLSSLCSHKMGLKPEAWKQPDTEIYRFKAEVYHESGQN